MLEKYSTHIIDGVNYCVAESFMIDNINYVYLFKEGDPTIVMCGKIINNIIVEIEDQDEFDRFARKIRIMYLNH